VQKGEKHRRRQRRKRLLLRLLKDILKGDFDNTPELLDKLYNNNPPRRQYMSPRERDSYNYGYKEIDEMGASTPNVWR